MEEVLEFAKACGVTVTADLPEPCAEVTFDRLNIHCDFRQTPDFPEMVDALADISVVNIGAFIACGVRATPILEMVDANNLAKIARGHKDEHGKWVKPEGHIPPDIDYALVAQGYQKAVDIDEMLRDGDRSFVETHFTQVKETGRWSSERPHTSNVAKTREDDDPPVEGPIADAIAPLEQRAADGLYPGERFYSGPGLADALRDFHADRLRLVVQAIERDLPGTKVDGDTIRVSDSTTPGPRRLIFKERADG